MWCWTVWSNLENGKRREACDILHFLSSLSSLRAKTKSGGGGIGAPRIRRQSRALALECRTKWCNIIYFFALCAPLRVDFFSTLNAKWKCEALSRTFTVTGISIAARSTRVNVTKNKHSLIMIPLFYEWTQWEFKLKLARSAALTLTLFRSFYERFNF